MEVARKGVTQVMAPFRRNPRLEVVLGAQPAEGALHVYADWLLEEGDELGATAYRCLAGTVAFPPSPTELQVVYLACAVSRWVLQHDIAHRFAAFELGAEHAAFRALETSQALLSACARRFGRSRAQVPELAELDWSAAEAPGLPSRERVEELWKGLGALAKVARTPADARAAVEAVASARAASDWRRFREAFEVAVAGSRSPFVIDRELSRTLGRKPRATELEPITWADVTAFSFPLVPLNNSSSGVTGRVFPLTSASATVSPLTLLAMVEAEDDLGEEYDELSAEERAEWFDDTGVSAGPWTPLSWCASLDLLFTLLAENHGWKPTDDAPEVHLSQGQTASLPAALAPLGAFVSGASSEAVTMLRFQSAWLMLRCLM
ncbi:MAG: hypothetical protein Q8S33_19850 [Myxococcales bacterium]|nr:hypothetical protein [Myxococcales bacterium]